MPTTLDLINRALREFRRYTGDGLPGEPANAPLPIGDPQSGPWSPKKADLREAFRATVEAAADVAEAIEDIGEAVAETDALRQSTQNALLGFNTGLDSINSRLDTFAASTGNPAALDAYASTLDHKYTPRGLLASNANLNTIIKPGTYFGTSAATMTGLPAGMAVGVSFYLFVEPYGTTVGASSANRFVPQTIELLSDRGTSWKRGLDQSNPVTAWLPGSKPTAGQIVPAMLSSSFEYRGVLNGVSANTVVADGLYLITGAVTDLPNGVPAGGLLEVRNFNSSYVLQIWRGLSDPSAAYARTIRPGVPTYFDWMPLFGSGGGGTSSLAGKKIVCFGDSITEFGNYPALIAAQTGATVFNAGFGGCRMAAHTGTSVSALYDPFSMYRLSEYMANNTWSTLTAAADALFAAEGDDNRPNAATLAAMDWNTVDIITILYGTNDFAFSVPIGSDADADGTTFKGAINVTINNIMATYKHIKVMFVTPLFRARDGGSDVATTTAGAYLRDYADAIIDRASARQVEWYDLYRTCNINMLNHTQYLIDGDGVHPVPGYGYQHLASKIGSALEARF